MDTRLNESIERMKPALIKQAREALPNYLRSQFDEGATITILSKNDRPIYHFRTRPDNEIGSGLAVTISARR